jgi:hypothetical protein
MSTRFLTNLTVLTLGAFVVVVSQAFAVSTFMWLMFGAGIAALAIAGPGLAIPSRGLTQRALDGLIGVLGASTIVASMVFAGATITWLGFAAGAALFALAIVGLTLHELTTDRVVHSIEVSTPTTEHHELAGVQVH